MPTSSQHRTEAHNHPVTGGDIHVLHQHAVARMKAADFHGALEGFEKVLAQQPYDATAAMNAAHCAYALQQTDAAWDFYQRATQHIEPRAVDLLLLGNLCQDRRHFEEATMAYAQALALGGPQAILLSNQANAFKQLGQFAHAGDLFVQALKTDPHYSPAWNNAAELNVLLGQFDVAEQFFQQALQITPQEPSYLWNLALLYWRVGDLAAALPLHEARFDQPRLRIHRKHPIQTQWTSGEEVKGRRILVWEEQGLGDKVMMMRYAKLLADQGAHVILEVPPSLLPLARTLDERVSYICTGEDPGPFDTHCPYMSLPLAFGTTLESIPAFPAYLKAPAQVEQRWQERLGPRASDELLRVGLVWSGASGHHNDHHRSMALEELSPLLEVAGVRYWSLQKEVRAADQAVLKAWGGLIRDESARLSDFGETAGLIAQMDVVISVDTSVAHVAAAMGKPVWLLLPADADYRWMDQRNDSPWYPTVQLFRQTLNETFAPLPDSKNTRWEHTVAELVRHLRLVRPTLPKMSAATLSLRKKEIRTCIEQHDQLGAQRRLEHLLEAGIEDTEILNQLGNIYQLSDKQPQAIALYEKALKLNPNLITTQSNLGGALLRTGKHTEALHQLQKAAKVNGKIPQLQYNLGSALYELERHEEALKHFEAALRLDPKYFLAHVYRSNVLMALDRNNDAMQAIEDAFRINPNYPEIHYNRAIVLQRLGRFHEARESYEKSIALKPNFHKALWNYSLLLLLQGDYERGWPLYEERWFREESEGRRQYPQPIWQGQSSLQGKYLLIYPEQGLGDYIQCLRYVPMLVERGAHVYLETPAAMMGMVQCLAGPFVSVFELNQAPQNFDMHCPCMTLPLAFGTRVDTIPNPGPYLRVPEEFQRRWQARMPRALPHKPLRVGLTWSGAAGHKNDKQRSVRLDQLLPMFELADVEFHSLQREYREHDMALLEELKALNRLHDHAHNLNHFADTAALIQQLDLVISVDTSVAHMAGAIGAKVWLLIAFEPDFRWLLERSDTPWYDNFELFRQPDRGDWPTVVQRVCRRLHSHVIDI